MRRSKLLSLVLGVVFVFGCSQATTTALIKDGSEAGSLAGLEIAQAKLSAAEYKVLVTGLNDVDTAALALLNDTTSTLTLQQVVSLVFSADPNVAKYAAIIEYALPILGNVLSSNAMSTAVNKLSSKDKAYAIAFFEGNQLACADASGTMTLEQLLKNKPELVKAMQKADIQAGKGKFDPPEPRCWLIGTDSPGARGMTSS